MSNIENEISLENKNSNVSDLVKNLSQDEIKAKYQENLKKGIQKLYNQLKKGCSKKYCFNKGNCINDIDFDEDKLKLNINGISDKELITRCIKTVGSTEYLDTLFCLDLTENIEYKSKFVTQIDEWYHIVCNSKLVFCPKKAEYIAKKIVINGVKENNFEAYTEIIIFNKVINKILIDLFSDVLKDNNSEIIEKEFFGSYSNKITEVNRKRLIEYLFKMHFNFFNFMIVNNFFDYNINHKKDIYNFFENYCVISNQILKIKNLKSKTPAASEYFTSMFVEYVFYSSNKNIILNNKKLFLEYHYSNFQETNKVSNTNMEIDYIESKPENKNIDYFLENIHNLNNFLTILVLDLTTSSEEPSTKDIKLLVGFLRIFEYFYFANKKYRMISNEIFANEKVNNYLSLKVQFLSYFKYHYNKSENMNIISNEAECFSFIKYYFLYDSGSKKDIISQYNSRLQHLEVSSSFDSIESLLASGTRLTFEILRNDLIKSTLDIIAKNLNFRMPLKVSDFIIYLIRFT